MELKSWIDGSVGGFVNVVSEVGELRGRSEKRMVGMMVLNVLVELVDDVMEVRVVVVMLDELL